MLVISLHVLLFTLYEKDWGGGFSLAKNITYKQKYLFKKSSSLFKMLHTFTGWEDLRFSTSVEHQVGKVEYVYLSLGFWGFFWIRWHDLSEYMRRPDWFISDWISLHIKSACCFIESRIETPFASALELGVNFGF